MESRQKFDPGKWLETIHLRRRHVLGGEGVKNLPNLPTDSTKKLPTVGAWSQKLVKIC